MSTRIGEPTWVMAADIAKLCGVSRQAVANWAVRHSDFPPVYQHLAMGRIWRWSEVKHWLILHGKLDD